MDLSMLIQFVLAVLVVVVWRHFETVVVTLTSGEPPLREQELSRDSGPEMG